MKNNNNIQYDNLKADWIKKTKDYLDEYEPVYEGCKNDQCFCTGACKKINGYVKKSRNLIQII